MKNIYFKKYAAVFTMFILTATLIIIPTTIAKNVNISNSNDYECTTGRGGVPPTIVDFDGPGSVDINETSIFYVKAIDQNNHQIRYLFDWKYYHDQEFNVDEISAYYGSNQTIQISHTFDIGGYYDIAVKAENVNGDQSEILIHDFKVNGGQVNLEITETWTKPDRFIPEQFVELYFTTKNIGNRDGYNYDLYFYLDGKFLQFFCCPPRIVRIICFRIESGESYSENWYCTWPDDYDIHEIKYYFDSVSACLYKSAVENEPPFKPSKPSGPITGRPEEEYTYSSTTTDPCEHDIFYLFDWGDGQLSTWLGPYESGQPAYASHKWYGGDYKIKVKAKDEHGLESDWSDPLEIQIRRNRAINIPLLRFLVNHQCLFALLQQLLMLLRL